MVFHDSFHCDMVQKSIVVIGVRTGKKWKTKKSMKWMNEHTKTNTCNIILIVVWIKGIKWSAKHIIHLKTFLIESEHTNKLAWKYTHRDMYALLGVKKSVSNHCQRRNVHGLHRNCNHCTLTVRCECTYEWQTCACKNQIQSVWKSRKQTKDSAVHTIGYPTQCVCAPKGVIIVTTQFNSFSTLLLVCNSLFFICLNEK